MFLDCLKRLFSIAVSASIIEAALELDVVVKIEVLGAGAGTEAVGTFGIVGAVADVAVVCGAEGAEGGGGKTDEVPLLTKDVVSIGDVPVLKGFVVVDSDKIGWRRW